MLRPYLEWDLFGQIVVVRNWGKIGTRGLEPGAEPESLGRH